MKHRASHTTVESVKDYAGRIWLIYHSRPTDHGWQLLLGRPTVDNGGKILLKGGIATIITRELAEYMKEHRLLHTPLRLPISKTVSIAFARNWA